MFNYEPCCANCKYANWYPIPYMFPWCSPKCSKHKKDILHLVEDYLINHNNYFNVNTKRSFEFEDMEDALDARRV